MTALNKHFRQAVAVTALANLLTAGVSARAEAADPCNSIATLTAASVFMGFIVGTAVRAVALVACHALE